MVRQKNEIQRRWEWLYFILGVISRCKSKESQIPDELTKFIPGIPKFLTWVPEFCEKKMDSDEIDLSKAKVVFYITGGTVD